MKLAGVKGQGKFIVVLVNLDTHKLLGLAPERKQSEIEKVGCISVLQIHQVES
jgi:hypothetical protein